MGNMMLAKSFASRFLNRWEIQPLSLGKPPCLVPRVPLDIYSCM